MDRTTIQGRSFRVTLTYYVAVALLSTLVFLGWHAPRASAAGGPPPVVPRYNEVHQKSSHNSYVRAGPLLDQLIYHRVRSLELDIHNYFHRPLGPNGPIDFEASRDKWRVYHGGVKDGLDFELESSCTWLTDCLQELRAFHGANPQHEVVTVWIELKDAWSNWHTPEGLDARILDVLPADALWTPADLLATCSGATTLQEAIETCGWPFACIDSCGDIETLEEDAHILGVQVNSDDIWGSADNFYFLYEYTTTSGNVWTTAVSTANNSSVEDWAKGCLMARASTAANSPYFAVCRPADNERLRVQWRDTSGGGSHAVEGDIMPSNTISEESISFIKLRVFNNNTCAEGFGSQDGQTWKRIGDRCFTSALHRQGLASSAHGNQAVKFLYTNLTKNGVAFFTDTFPNHTSIGTVRSASAFDAVLSPEEATGNDDSGGGTGGGCSACNPGDINEN